MVNMTLHDMIVSAVRAAGGDGLVNCDIGCGCSLDDLAPCDAPNVNECRAAKGRVLGQGEYLGDCSPGDVWFTAIEG